MIREIQITPPLATYINQASLTDLRTINYIFGANGSGKTTISRVIAGTDGYSHSPLSWQGDITLERMVYNRDFVERNFNQEGPLRGVFTLGENQVEAEQEIAGLMPEIDKVNSQISSLNIQLDGEEGLVGKRKELQDLEPDITKKCFIQKQIHDEYFQVAFTGVRNSADSFKNKVFTEAASNTADLLTLEELKDRAQTIFAEGVERVSSLSILSASNLIEVEEHELLEKVIVGNQDVDIAGLIEQLGNSDWVKQGRQYHQQNPTTCPFCQQTTDGNFSQSLDEFFSDAYDKDMVALQRLATGYQTSTDQLRIAVQSNVERGNPFLNDELYSAEAQTLVERLNGNSVRLKAKLDEPSRKIELEPIKPLLEKLCQLVAEANEATSAHNLTVANLATEKQKLTSQVWRYVLNELDEDLSQYQTAKNRLTQAISGMEQSLRVKNEQVRELNDQIKELERQTTSVQPTISAINDLLLRFGFTSFLLGEADEGRHYKIIRANGEDAAHSLSEGEKTFITFLYFYHLIKGAQAPSGIISNRVVVFDDPISSLDSDILYIVSTLIKGVMEESRDDNSQIKQVFILTHNVYFHKEISFSMTRPSDGALNEESFWQVKKHEQGSTVVRCQSNPIRSAYELLWEDIKCGNISSVNLQNTLRRILENYFKIWGGISKDEICALFDGRDKLICQSLFSWVNDGSHSIHDDLYINHGDQTNEAYLRVFKDIFDKSGQLGHYEMMVGTPDN
ncbi:AAA family ATPase [Alteromonas sp. BMJM2]|uniref:AAA family ATPase n=1 Tax=Alteromonas sp. BMJM2 TaxID=2954241 RepID=UPI0022B36D79|nr:AAA family ATPase [Alteromonas sp. BMJM2]